MSKNIKYTPLKFLGGIIKAFGAASQKGKYQDEEKRAQASYDEMRAKYMGLDTSNLYGDVSNPYANMQNTMEDLTVNQQQAQFEAQQGAQTRANVMGQMRGAAGSSGVAGLAQAMANQGATQAQQAGQLQTMERQGAWKADMTRRAGAEQSRTLEKDKVSTLYTMATNRLGTAKTAHQTAQDQMWSGVGEMFSPTGGMF